MIDSFFSLCAGLCGCRPPTYGTPREVTGGRDSGAIIFGVPCFRYRIFGIPCDILRFDDVTTTREPTYLGSRIIVSEILEVPVDIDRFGAAMTREPKYLGSRVFVSRIYGVTYDIERFRSAMTREPIYLGSRVNVSRIFGVLYDVHFFLTKARARDSKYLGSRVDLRANPPPRIWFHICARIGIRKNFIRDVSALIYSVE